MTAQLISEINSAIARLEALVAPYRGAAQMTDLFPAIEHVLGITRDQILSDGRNSELAYARQLAFYTGCKHLLISYSEMSRLLKRNHSAAFYNVRAFQNRLDTKERGAANDLELVKKRLP